MLAFAYSLWTYHLLQLVVWWLWLLLATYGNTGCRVLHSEMQNPLDVCLKVKCSKEFFDIFWNVMMASLQNLDQFLKNKLVKKSPHNFLLAYGILVKYFKVRCCKSKCVIFFKPCHCFILKAQFFSTYSSLCQNLNNFVSRKCFTN